MSAFRKFGIERLSPSSINCWIATPGLWTLRYLAGARDDGSPAAWRGTAVEAGLHNLLLGKPLEEATAAANIELANRSAGEITDEIRAEAGLIPGMMGQAALWLAHSSPDCVLSLAATQLKVETRLDGVSVPVIGFIDFTFMDGPDIDCKTTKACPSKPKPDHLRQLALYWQARQKPQALLYITDKRHAYFPVPEDDLRRSLSDLTRAAQSLERFLSIVPDRDAAIRALPVDRDHYTWSPAAEQALAHAMEAF